MFNNNNLKENWQNILKKKLHGVIQLTKKEEVKSRLEIERDLKKIGNKDIVLIPSSRQPSSNDQVNYGQINMTSAKQQAYLNAQIQEKQSYNDFVKIRPEFEDLREKVHLNLQKVMKQSERNIITKKKKSKIKSVNAYKVLLSQNMKEEDIPMQVDREENNRKAGTPPFLKSSSSEKYETSQSNVSSVLASQIANKSSNHSKYDYKSMKTIKFKTVEPEVPLNPRNIENIVKLEEKKFKEKIGYRNNKKPELEKFIKGDNLRAQIISYIEDDFIEDCSVIITCETGQSPREDIPFFRELGPCARELVNMRENSKKKKTKVAIDILQEYELNVDEELISYHDIVNIVSGRISCLMLHRILNKNDIHSLIEEEDNFRTEIDELDIQVTSEAFSSVEDQKKKGPENQGQTGKPMPALTTKQESGASANSQGTTNNQGGSKFGNNIFLKKAQAGNPKESLNPGKAATTSQIEIKPFSSSGSKDNPPAKQTEDKSKDLPSNQGVPVKYANSPTQINQINKNRLKESLVDTEAQAYEEEIYNETREKLSKLEEVLKDIDDIKEARANSLKLPSNEATVGLWEEFSRKLEIKLNQLLYYVVQNEEIFDGKHILVGPSGENPEDLFNYDPKRGKLVLKELLNNLDKLKGKEIHGHLKTKLLFQYLKDYKKLQEERELGMIIVQAENDKDLPSKEDNTSRISPRTNISFQPLSPPQNEAKNSKGTPLKKSLQRELNPENLSTKKGLKTMHSGWGVKPVSDEKQRKNQGKKPSPGAKGSSEKSKPENNVWIGNMDSYREFDDLDGWMPYK